MLELRERTATIVVHAPGYVWGFDFVFNQTDVEEVNAEVVQQSALCAVCCTVCCTVFRVFNLQEKRVLGALLATGGVSGG